MNIFVLRTMRYLDNPELFTSDEMWENANNAHAIANAYIATIAGVDFSVANAATAAYDADFDDDYTNYCIDKYFKKTNEDRQTYINEVERLK